MQNLGGKQEHDGELENREYTNEFKYNLRDKFDVSEIIDILGYGKYATRVPDVVSR